MPETSNDISFAILIIGLVLGSLGLFVIALVVMFYRRAIRHKSDMTKIEAEKSQDLLKSALNAQEKERRRIGSDIHDDVGPLLSLLKLQLSNIARKSSDSSQNKLIKESKDTIDSIIKNVRRVSRDLAPAVLFELGLEEALFQIEEKLKSLTSAKVEFTINCSLSTISSSQALAIHRVLQESLNNILKHADADKIDVDLSCDESILKIEISDNGKGFNTEKINDGCGLNNIRARAKMFGGNLSVQSKLDNGTVLIITMKAAKHEN